MPTQNRLSDALVEKVEGGLNNFKVRKTNQTFNYFLFQFFILTFLSICEILWGIVGFYAIVFFSQYTHCCLIYLYSAIMILFNACNLY